MNTGLKERPIPFVLLSPNLLITEGQTRLMGTGGHYDLIVGVLDAFPIQTRGANVEQSLERLLAPLIFP